MATASTTDRFAGAVLLGVAIARLGGVLRWAGIGYAAGLALFAVSGFALSVAQPVAAALAAAAGGGHRGRSPATRELTRRAQ